MAEVLDDFQFTGGRGSYPDEWFDGKIRKLVRGDDFTAKPTSLRQSLGRVARDKHQKSIRVKIIDDDTVVIQAVAQANSGGRKRGR